MIGGDVICPRAGPGLTGLTARAVNASIAISHASLTVRDADVQSVGVVCPRRVVMRRHGLRRGENRNPEEYKRDQGGWERYPDPVEAEGPENCNQWTGQHILSKSGIRRPGYGRNQLDPCGAKGRGDSSTGEYNCRIAAWSMTLLRWRWPESIALSAYTAFIYITYDRLHRPQSDRTQIRQLTAGRTAAHSPRPNKSYDAWASQDSPSCPASPGPLTKHPAAP